jgi:hypothetical protein
MSADQVQQIIELLGMKEIPNGNILEYQALEIEGQSVIHVVIGKELLSYIWLLMDPEQIEPAMPLLLDAGQDERRTRKAQCFKLVIATTNTSAIEFNAHKAFKDYPEKNNNTELHITQLPAPR